MRADHRAARGIAVARQAEIGVEAGIVPDLQPFAAGERLEEGQRARLDLREGRAADALRVGRHPRDLVEEMGGEAQFLRPVVAGGLAQRGHGAASMKTTPSFCSSSITVPIRSRTEASFSRSR